MGYVTLVARSVSEIASWIGTKRDRAAGLLSTWVIADDVLRASASRHFRQMDHPIAATMRTTRAKAVRRAFRSDVAIVSGSLGFGSHIGHGHRHAGFRGRFQHQQQSGSLLEQTLRVMPQAVVPCLVKTLRQDVHQISTQELHAGQPARAPLIRLAILVPERDI